MNFEFGLIAFLLMAAVWASFRRLKRFYFPTRFPGQLRKRYYFLPVVTMILWTLAVAAFVCLSLAVGVLMAIPVTIVYAVLFFNMFLP